MPLYSVVYQLKLFSNVLYLFTSNYASPYNCMYNLYAYFKMSFRRQRLAHSHTTTTRLSMWRYRKDYDDTFIKVPRMFRHITAIIYRYLVEMHFTYMSIYTRFKLIIVTCGEAWNKVLCCFFYGVITFKMHFAYNNVMRGNKTFIRVARSAHSARNSLPCRLLLSPI